MPALKPRIELPTNAGDIIELAKAIAAKHAELAAASPLSQLKWPVITPAIAAADTAHRDSKRFEAQAETATEARDNALKAINQFVRDARDILGAVNSDERHKLADYGFSVVAAGASPAAKATDPAIAGK